MPEHQPLDLSELIFPSAHTSLNTTIQSLKRHNLSVTNRLHSIIHDAQFVEKVASTYNLPLIANERCGSWYIPPSRKAGSAYFKSTDGHHGQWSFSLRRLNLHLLELIGRCQGCIIVDSTRRGKSMPDGLSKTLPIWITVLNRFLFPDDTQGRALRTPQDVVSGSEHTQIEDRLSQFVIDLQNLGLDPADLRRKLNDKPMKAVWITPDSAFSDLSGQDATCSHLVVLCTASGRTSSGGPTSDYVQGAADDSEAWAHNLDAETFWKHQNLLLSTFEDDLPATISSLISQSRLEVSVRTPTQIKPTDSVWLANNAAAEKVYKNFEIVVSCSKESSVLLSDKLKGAYIHLDCSTGKVGSRELRTQLPKLDRLRSLVSHTSKILITCQTGRDLAVGVALALTCSIFSEDGTLQMFEPANTLPALSKATIKQHLSWIVLSMPDAAPSRATLQSVNAFLLG